MKPILTSLMALLLCLNANAQSNFYKMTIGAGAGATQSFADLAKHDYGFAGYGAFDYLFTPFVSLGLEGQMGEINGGDVNTDPNNRQFINSYKAFAINGKISLGALINYQRNSFANAIKGLYVGAGAGVVMNKMRFVVREKPDGSGYIFPGKDSSNDLLIPLNVGIAFNFMDRYGYSKYGINFNYQTNITLGEGLDGYDDSPLKFKSGNPDIYTYFSIGLKYHFGSVGLSTKTLY
ncbi:MAG: outer membrane beta-barrel protein [Candidatus Pedobacter colombiensis]|uniref:Outer membrane beta-barrel protein n=1 Tax=Candidatus Pedobacter colombiensis TaxID=3121371 RepID=A0AAJ5WAX6_9SPHI|nr:outer membrane beta-barrel protein [Pedobacter sp.]WEK19437.1 MAG: outer membrane beta-barrel protein [Pedobacter sp.]